MGFELRPYQTAAVDALLADLRAGRKNVACVLPTGSGKTEIFCETARRIVPELDGSILVLSHLGFLGRQTLRRFEQRTPSLLCGVMQGDLRPAPNANIIISTMQTARSEHHISQLKHRLTKAPKLLFVDEAHMLETPSYNTIRHLLPDAALVGFTATPFRGNRVMTSIFEKVSYSMSLQELIDAGYLVPPKVHQIVDRGDTDADKMANVLGLYKTYENGNSVVVYMSTIETAKQMRDAFRDIGVTAEAVTDDISGTKRDDILERFQEGKVHVLTTVNVLTAGFDAPAIRAIFMPYGTSSPTTYIQRVGRGLRPSPDGFEGVRKTACAVYVAGDAPSVSHRAYERLTTKLLLAGGAPRDFGTLTETVEYNEPEEISVWAKTAYDAVEKMRKLGMEHFARLLDSKDFPARFSENIASLLSSLPDKPTSLPNGQRPASEAQKVMLFRAGFGSSQLSALTKAEASMMLSAIVNSQMIAASSSSQKFVVPEGKHAGKHVSELPFAYRGLVKKRYPDSPVARVIIEWEKDQKP